MRLLPIILLFLCQGVIGQTRYYTRSVDWQISRIENNSGNFEDITSFKDSYYQDFEKNFPLFFENIPLEKGVKPVHLSLLKTQTEVLPTNILPGYFRKNLTSEFKFRFYNAVENGTDVIQYTLFPFRVNPMTGEAERLVSFALKLDYEEQQVIYGEKDTHKSMTGKNSPLATGDWYKFRIEEEGIHKISYNVLSDLGIGDPENIRIYGWGGRQLPEDSREGNQHEFAEIPVYVNKGTDGIFNSGDYVLFYALGTVKWKYNETDDFFHHEKNPYSDFGYYFIQAGSGTFSTPPEAPLISNSPDYITNSYDIFRFHEEDDVNLLKSGREWYGEIFDVITDRTFSFEFPSLETSSEIRLETFLLGRAKDKSSYIIRGNGKVLDTTTINATSLGGYTATYAYTSHELYSFYSNSGTVNIRLSYLKPDPGAKGWLDYLALNARAGLNMEDDQCVFRDRKSRLSTVTEYDISGVSSNTQVWDITNYPDIRRVNGSFSGNSFSFLAEGGNIKEYLAFNPDGNFPEPGLDGEGFEKIENQNLLGSGNPDMVIISYRDFLPYAEELAAYRSSHNGLEVLVTTPEKIYNEFSSGRPDITAIRNFIQYLYLDAGDDDELKPEYLLLFGDGSYIFKSDNPNDGNLVPAYQSKNSLSPTSSFVTDDFYGLLDPGENISSGLIDIGIGRLPVSNTEEAEAIVKKIRNYESPEQQGLWRNTIAFVGDDEDNNTHMEQADELAAYVEENYPAFNVNKIYLDAYEQISTPVGQRYPDVNKAINEQVNKGALIVNYTGHGGAKGLAHERILEVNDIQSWNNDGKLPLFMTATCEFSRFDEPDLVSAGEQVILNPSGGGIALFTTTRLVYSGPNYILNEKFYEIVFEKGEDGNNYCLGDIMKYSKNNTGVGINKRNFTLLGDPAMKLTYPFHQIVADSINHSPAYAVRDTLKALSEVRITGHVEDSKGALLDGFNGVIYPIVYDKPSEMTTLANDGGNKKNFKIRNSILYKGKATVENGYFSFSFIVPKDINYAFGPGKISFYSSDSTIDASGAYMDFKVGGSSNDFEADFEGPEVEIYMNNTFFREGGITDENPVLYVKVYDEQGINTTGNSIGHDITAILNGESQKSVVLNDYYQADLNSYQSGTISYPLSGLDEGHHVIEVKVWDIFNNSTEQSIDFLVVKSNEMLLENLMNYPNPFRESTYFSFEHNKSDQDLEITIDIFNMSGALVRTIKAKEYGSGFRSRPIYWNGENESGNHSRQGTYLYRIRVISSDGTEGVKTGRLIILR